jgi:hypothetical protein
MGILDEAIKEHLELKRQHGADQSELQKLEDEAFGASERPGTEGPASDALAEAPTQFMAQPETESPEEGSEAREEGETSATADAGESDGGVAATEEPPARGRTEIADLQEPPVESTDAEQAPAEEPSPAMEHEAISEPAVAEEVRAEPPAAKEPQAEPPAEDAQAKADGAPSTEERHAIADQPTELYDVEAELGDAEPSDSEPEVHALSEEDEEFWDEKRLSDELDQALEAPVELREPDDAPAPEPPQAEPPAPEPESPRADAPPADKAPPTDPPRPGHEDALEETPDFLEDNPEDDQLWFEQKPPKDFDFDD